MLRQLLKNETLFYLYHSIVTFFAKVKWQGLQALFNNGIYYNLLEPDHDSIRSLLKQNYLVILTRRKCHLTTYLIAITSKLATGYVSHYTHALMNVEGDISNNMDYKIIEATGEGVHWSTFMQVFDCDSVALLKPKGLTLPQWTKAMDKVRSRFGSEYDTLFDIQDESKLSCVELVYLALKELPNFERRFPALVRLIESSKGELTPQMLYDCNDMEVVFEVRR